MIPRNKWIGIYTIGQFPGNMSKDSVDIFASDGSILVPSIHGYKKGSLQYRGNGQNVGNGLTVRFSKGHTSTTGGSGFQALPSSMENSDSKTTVHMLSYKWEIKIISKFYCF